MTFLLLKALHLAMVGLTFVSFNVRGLWMLRESPMLHRRWVRIVPHAIDTLLLAAGIGLALMLHQYPFVDGWLTAKLAGLLVYIGLGMIALRRGHTRRVRIAAWIGAAAAFGYIVAVAVTRNPAPFP